VHLVTERAFSEGGEHKEEERAEKCSFSNAIIALSESEARRRQAWQNVSVLFVVLSGRLVFEERWSLFLPISLPGKRDLQPFPAESGKGSGSILVIQAHQHSVLKPFLRSRSDFPIPFHHSA
jgi:hypothetical protein